MNIYEQLFPEGSNVRVFNDRSRTFEDAVVLSHLPAKEGCHWLLGAIRVEYKQGKRVLTHSYRYLSINFEESMVVPENYHPDYELLD